MDRIESAELGLSLAWQSENQSKVPQKLVLANDQISTDEALKLVRSGTALLWQGDFHNAKQLLSAMARRLDERSVKAPDNITQAFHQYRLAQAQKAQLLGLLLIPVEADYQIPLKRAPKIQAAATQAWSQTEPFAVSLRELLGVIGAYEWRKNGVRVPALTNMIYPFYGVFSPIRGEYLDLVAKAPLPESCQRAFDIGTGTGVLAAILARRGVPQVIATDSSERAVACATFNLDHLSLNSQVRVLQQDFFPEGKADLIVCNPPWLPGKSSTTLEAAIYDQNSQMLRGFLSGVASHLQDTGQAWLILSDLAEHLQLRSREQLEIWINEAGLEVLRRDETKPKHKRAHDKNAPLAKARQQEKTSLWCLQKQNNDTNR